MRYFTLIILLLLATQTADANEKRASQCVNSSGKTILTTKGCPSGFREVKQKESASLMQFAQKAREQTKVRSKKADNTDLTHYLTQNFAQTDWQENVRGSFLEKNTAVVVVDTFRIRKLEAICQATHKWIEAYPHSRFDLKEMRFEFNTGAKFDSRYVVEGRCNYRLR